MMWDLAVAALSLPSPPSPAPPARRRPPSRYGVYLDNYASGFRVVGNVLRGCSRAALFVHLGRDNVIAGNVFANVTNADDDAATAAAAASYAGGVLALAAKAPSGARGDGYVGGANNTLRQNIFAIARTRARCLFAASIGGAAVAREALGACDRNLFHSLDEVRDA